jgi:hypothetical protein
VHALRILLVAALFASLLPGLPPELRPAPLWAACALTAVGLAVHARAPSLLGKGADGKLPLWSYGLFWPWHVAVRVAAAFLRPPPRYSEIEPGLWIGAWPTDPPPTLDHAAVLDMTCELPRRGPSGPYLCIPTWDRTPPSVPQVERAVRFVLQHAGQRPVLVHCAHGRGRSSLVLAAVLLRMGRTSTVEESFDLIRSRRPRVRMTREQWETLRTWNAAHFPGPP